jgi:hypothetical protein
MYAQGHDQPAIGESAQRGRAEAGARAEGDPEPRRGVGRGAGGAEVIQDHRTQHRGEGKDGSDGEINPARDDHERHADSHDRDEAGVLGELGEILGVEEFVLLLKRRRALALRIGDEDPLPRAIRQRLEHGQADRAAEERQQNAQREDHEHEAAFLKPEDRAQGRTHRG